MDTPGCGEGDERTRGREEWEGEWCLRIEILKWRKTYDGGGGERKRKRMMSRTKLNLWRRGREVIVTLCTCTQVFLKNMSVYVVYLYYAYVQGLYCNTRNNN